MSYNSEWLQIVPKFVSLPCCHWLPRCHSNLSLSMGLFLSLYHFLCELHNLTNYHFFQCLAGEAFCLLGEPYGKQHGQWKFCFRAPAVLQMRPNSDNVVLPGAWAHSISVQGMQSALVWKLGQTVPPGCQKDHMFQHDISSTCHLTSQLGW